MNNNSKVPFNENILIIGYGSVSQCTLPLLLGNLDVPKENITVLDFENKSSQLEKFTEQGIKFVQKKITPETLNQYLIEHAGNNGMIIDLAWNIGANNIIGWCHDHNTLYVNTSVESWNPDEAEKIFEKTLYFRQMNLRKMSKNWPKNSTTAIVDHGANPGLISHFAKHGLIDIAERAIEDKKFSKKDLEEITEYKDNLDFPHLAQKLGVKVIHCSERDTQITNQPKQVNEFVNTWSIEGFREEGTAPSEIGWGTHEKEYFFDGLTHKPPYGPKNQIFIAQRGVKTWARSWVPEAGEIVGMIIRHGEAFGISDRLTVKENRKVVYRPTVHYVYMPCHEALSSLVELEARAYNLQPELRIMGDEITSGKDILGALIMGHPYNSWWTGSSLSIEQTREIIPGQNATTLQVAAGVISAVKYMVENPNMGLLLPDDLPHDYILQIAKPYLGNFISQPYDWTPLKNRRVAFHEHPESQAREDPWQFKNFMPLP